MLGQSLQHPSFVYPAVLGALGGIGAVVVAGSPLLLGAVAQGAAQGGQAQDGLRVIADALAMVEKNDERWSEAELYRLKGQLTLQQSNTNQDKSEVATPRPLTPDPQVEAEECFHNALALARRQEAKSLELRAATSLARLFDTKDLQEAKMLMEALAEKGRYENERSH